jgi:type IV pilus assembly protein PilV
VRVIQLEILSCRNYKTQSGFSFVEVLVTLLILALGLLAIAGLEITALKQTQQAYYRSIATLQIISMLERLRANQTATTHERELSHWNQQNNLLLPKSHGDYVCAEKLCTVTLHWQQQQLTLRAEV